MKKASFFLLIVLPLLVACGTGSSTPTVAPQTLTLVAQDIAYDKTALEGTIGQPIQLDFSNQGALAHDFTIDEIEATETADSHDSHNESTATESDLHYHLETNEAQVFTFTPLQAGTYTFYCSVAGHREAGMTGILTVAESQP
ncbi:MAG: cupredoxin domain-containing protein [Ardenticatenales bacterium]|nr:cupredoxin domain-containing protein [Ardenticatenales bacterium]